MLPRRRFCISVLLASCCTVMYYTYAVLDDPFITATFRTNVPFPKNIHSLVNFPDIQRKDTTNADKTDRKQSILLYKSPLWISAESLNTGLSKCAYNNCYMTHDIGDLKSHSAILFSEGLEKYPPLTQAERPRDQVWVFFYMESSHNIKSRAGVVSSHWRSTINWTMTYRTDSDVLRSYGMLRTRTSPYKADYGQIYYRKSKIAAWIVSHCDARSGRDQYVRELLKHGLPIDIYGKCGDKGKLNESAKIDMLNNVYMFYLAFENSLCPDYITEKFFDTFRYDIVLVARGGANYSKLLPPETFIDASNFPSPKKLAKYLLDVSFSKDLYTKHLQNKNTYEGHGFHYMANYSSCSLCEKLNNIEDNRNVYEDLNSYIYNDFYSCYEPNDVLYGRNQNYLITVPMLFPIICIYILCVLHFYR